MNKQFYIPGDGWLKKVVPLIWQTEGRTTCKKETIIPLGLTEIIFNFSGESNIPAEIGNERQPISRCVINGFNTANVLLQLPENQAFFGIRFHPSGIKNILGVPAGEFANQAIELTLIDKSFNSLWHLLAAQNSFYRRVSLLCNWITQHYFNIDPRDNLLNNFLGSPNQPTFTVSELSHLVNYSPRHLSRKMYGLTGMNTEEILCYKKYLHSVNLIHNTNRPLTEIAYDCRFSDQSHFIKTFKLFTCITPGEYRKSKTGLPGHILSNVR